MPKSLFLEDIYPPDLLYAITIRSPVAKGRYEIIDFPELPGQYTIITAKDIPGENRLEDTSMPVLADSRLSYIGEPVALLAGPDKIKLEELAAECRIIAIEEKPVFTYAEASAADSNEYLAAARIFQNGNFFDEPDTQDDGSRPEGETVKGSYTTGIQDHWYAEPAGAIAWLKGHQDILEIKTATQWPNHVKRCVAKLLNFDKNRICVEQTALSLHMDGKLWFPSLISCHAALISYHTKKPVRLILNRMEDFLFSPKRCNCGIDINSKVGKNGKILSSEIDIFVNLGAFGVNANEILDQVCLGCIGYYNAEKLKINAKAYKANLPPHGPFSGFGLSQGFFAMERHVSAISDICKINDAQWRIEHGNPGIILPKGAKNDSSAAQLIELAAKMSDYHRKWASYELLRCHSREKHYENPENPRGIGIAFGFQGNGLLYGCENQGTYGVEVTLTKEGKLEIRTSISSSEAYDKIWNKIAADSLSIAPDSIYIITEPAPDCGPSTSSRNITAVSKAVERCCEAIRKQRFHSPLPITVRRVIRGQYGSLAENKFAPPAGKEMDISGFTKLATACAVVEVAIDLVECIPKVRGVYLGVDGGKIISVNRARRNITRNTVQALGWAFQESIEYENGLLPRYQYDNFAIPSPAEIPPINVEFAGKNADSKGIGEIPFTCVPAAFIQAVSQAMDHNFSSIPLKRGEIWDIVRRRKAEASSHAATADGDRKKKKAEAANDS